MDTTERWVERTAWYAEVDPYKWMDEELDEIQDDDPEAWKDAYLDMLDDEDYDYDYESEYED